MKSSFAISRPTLSRFIACGLALLIAGLACNHAHAQDEARPQMHMQKDGSISLENALIHLTLSTKAGLDQGILAWRFKPLDAQMVDVLYGQTDYLTGHLLGQVWDPVNIIGYQPDRPRTGQFFPPVTQGAAKDGSAIMLTQVASDSSRLSRQVILRRDLAVVEVRDVVTNLTAQPLAVSLRYHNILSPGSEGGRQNRHEIIMLPSEKGVLQLDQSMTRHDFDQLHKGERFFNAAWADEPARSWVRGPQPTAALTGNWAVQTGANNGQAMAIIAQPDTLVGFYNSLGSTLEPVFKAFKLMQGQSWETTTHLASFSGLSENLRQGVVTRATPLYVAMDEIHADANELRGRMIPLFQGTLRGVQRNAKGKQPFMEIAATPTQAITLQAALPDGPWELHAIDTQGKRIGVIQPDGSALLDPITFQDATPAAPATRKLASDVRIGKDDRSRVQPFLADRDFVIYCNWHASEDLKAVARRMAHTLGVSVIWTQPDRKAIILGDPGNSSVVKQVGQFKHALSDTWPGKNKGVVLVHDNLELTQAPAIVAAGSDARGALQAALAFEKKFLKDITPPRGFVFRQVSQALKVQPYEPAGAPSQAPVTIHMARGEYEPAQFVLSAQQDLEDIDVTLEPLVHSETGQPMSRRYITRYRTRRGPLWLRWVNYFPLAREDGWTGMPDPLMDYPVKHMPANTSQGLWLTVIVPEDAKPGMYQSAITVTAQGQSQRIPLHVNVWDFTLPRTAIQGEPYMSLRMMAAETNRQLKPYHVERLVQNMVEHGMRIFTLDGDELVRWHFDASGKFKGKDLPWLIVSDDGKVALDVSGMASQMEQIEKAAAPFEVTYRMAINDLVRWPYGLADFRRTLPNRFDHLPPRQGHAFQSHQAQEMMSLLRVYLERTGQLDRFVLKIGDEPRTFQWWWDNLTQGARGAKLPFVTALNSVAWPEVEQALGSDMAWIQPLYMHYNPDFFARARQAGMKISWYNCGPPPRNISTTSASELRSYIWQAAKADLDIITWWGVQNWNHHGQHDVWHNRYSHWNSMVYPEHPDIKPWRAHGRLNDAAPIDTQRWEHIRDGMEDAAYVKLLRERIQAARAAKQDAAADKAQAVLDDIWRTIYPTHADYRPPFEQIMAARARIAQTIVSLNHLPAVAQKQN